MRPSEMGADNGTGGLALGGLALGGLAPLARTLVGLAILSGHRRGELFALRWKDIGEPGAGAHSARGGLQRDVRQLEDGAGARKIPLSTSAWGLIGEWKTTVDGAGPEALVFATRLGTSISPNNILRRPILPACERLGLPHTTWLSFRRTYSSWSHGTDPIRAVSC